MCNYPLAFVIMNLINVHHTATKQINKILLQRSQRLILLISIFKKPHLNLIFYVFVYNLPYIQLLL